jgi:hypothetical protein
MPAPVHVAPAPIQGGCGSCGSCGCSDSCDKPGLLDRIRARFHRDDCGCGCAPAPAPCHTCAPAPTCGCEKPGLFDRFRHGHDGCGGSCGSSCDNSCDRPCLFDRIRARFHRDDCGCAPTCGGCNGGCGAAPMPVVPVKPGEPLNKPKDGPMKLPEGDKPKDKETSTPKNLELTPTSGGPRIIESGTKNPF